MSKLNGTAPHDVYAEESILAATLQVGIVPDAVLRSQITPADFYRRSYGRVFEAMLALHERGAGIDERTLAAALGDAEEIGGAEILGLLGGPVPNLHAIGEHARIVAELGRRRREREALLAYQAEPTDAHRAALREALDEHPVGRRRVVIPASDYLARPRPQLDPYVTANDGRTILLAADTSLLVGGPSGSGKSLVSIDAAGLLASDDGGQWLDATVLGGRRVLLITLEGSDEDTADRLTSLIPPSARTRLFIDDRWAANRTVPTPADIGATVRAHNIDVVVIDTLPALLEGRHDLRRGIPESAHADFEDIRRRAGRPVTFIHVVHTRKLDRRAGAITDELEEIAGTFHKKVDAAVVIRRDEPDGPRRRVTFAKARRGPEPPTKIATLPDADSDEPPRLRVIAEAKPRLKEGTEAERIAEWIADQPEPVTVSVILAALDISKDTLARRRPELLTLGIRYAKPPGAARNSYAYGTPEQWAKAYGLMREDA